MLALVSLGEFLMNMSNRMPPGDARVKARLEAEVYFRKGAVISSDSFGKDHKRSVAIITRADEVVVQMQEEDGR